MAEFEADEYLSETLGPLQHWSGLQRFLIRHGYFLEHPLIELQPILDSPNNTLPIELLEVIQQPKALERLCD